MLIVEDEALLLQLSTLCLEELGLAVMPTAEPEEALALIRAGHAIDLLLTDVVMPRMNGHQLAECIRRLNPNIRILYASGYPVEVVESKGLLPLGSPFLRKPFSMCDLEETVKALLWPIHPAGFPPR